MEHQDNNAHEKAIASETLKKLHEDQQRRTSPIPKKKRKGRKIIVTLLVLLLIVAIWFTRNFLVQYWLEILVTVATAGLIFGGMYMLARLYAKKRQPKPQTESGRKISGKWKFAGLVLAVLLIVAGIFWTIPLIKGSTNSIQSNREKFVSDSTDLANATKAKQDTVVRLEVVEESATKLIEMLRQDSAKIAKLQDKYLEADKAVEGGIANVNSKVQELERLKALQQAPLIPATKRTVVLNVTMDGNKKQAIVSSGGATMTVVQN
jgi:hypothetical protein